MNLLYIKEALLLACSFKGAKIPEVKATLNCSRGAIRSTFSLAHLRNNGVSQPRIGGPKCYTEADERLLLRHVRANPKDNYPTLKKKLNLGMSKSMVDRILKKYGIHN
ncbi:hypothetical protein DL98DRAFT_523125 [Cadophora sp. DSE1049]|nr:hypothetical protein DL98DRAFT_523125 [Cadophora sp. DSE1049]